MVIAADTILRFAQAGVHNTNTMYALRFMVGLFESAFFPTGLYLLGSWYTPMELAKRTAIFHVSPSWVGASALNSCGCR